MAVYQIPQKSGVVNIAKNTDTISKPFCRPRVKSNATFVSHISSREKLLLVSESALLFFLLQHIYIYVYETCIKRNKILNMMKIFIPDPLNLF